MGSLKDVLDDHLGRGQLPGAVALVDRGGRTEVESVGWSDVGGTSPMTRESIFRVASLTKPITAAAVMLLAEDGRLRLEDPVTRWLPELESPRVVRAPAGPVDDVVPAARGITVHDVLSSRAGYGFPADFSLPAVQLLFSELNQGPPQPQQVAAPEDWMAALARIPLLHQPGEAWLYNTCSDIQGVLVARAAGQPFPEFLAERLFAPLGMTDTGFHVPAAKRERLTSYYRPGPDGLELVDAPDGEWSAPPAFPSGAGGLVSTVDDLLLFARMLLAGGEAADGRQLLSSESVRQMMTDHLTPAQRTAGSLFLEGQGWGYGGSVDVARVDPWNVPGRYGWIGGTGTGAHVMPGKKAVTILLSQVELTSPSAPPLMRDFWAYCAAV